MAEEVKNLTADLSPENTAVIIQGLDNSNYYCGTEYGEMSLEVPRSWWTSLPQEIILQGTFRPLAAHHQGGGEGPGHHLDPLPRWLHFACCTDQAHLTNRGDTDFIENMHEALRDLRSWLEDMIDLRKLANVSL
jgi:hypothetical protein